MEVIVEANIPPVQDSAKDIFNFLLLSFLTKSFISKCSFLKP